jgi:hypothetical protein
MKMIVADAHGQGFLVDKDGKAHELSPTKWTEADLQDTVVTGASQTATVRYRQDGIELEIGPDSVYQLEGIDNPDVIDVRGQWERVARELRDALDAKDDGRVVRLLSDAAGSDDEIPDAVEEEFFKLTGRTLREAIQAAMPWYWERLALPYVD